MELSPARKRIIPKPAPPQMDINTKIGIAIQVVASHSMGWTPTLPSIAFKRPTPSPRKTQPQTRTTAIPEVTEGKKKITRSTRFARVSSCSAIANESDAIIPKITAPIT